MRLHLTGGQQDQKRTTGLPPLASKAPADLNVSQIWFHITVPSKLVELTAPTRRMATRFSSRSESACRVDQSLCGAASAFRRTSRFRPLVVANG